MFLWYIQEVVTIINSLPLYQKLKDLVIKSSKILSVRRQATDCPQSQEKKNNAVANESQQQHSCTEPQHRSYDHN